MKRTDKMRWLLKLQQNHNEAAVPGRSFEQADSTEPVACVQRAHELAAAQGCTGARLLRSYHMKTDLGIIIDFTTI